MKLKEHLQQRQGSIKTRWLDKILDTYPDKTAVFLKQKRNRFANPVGHTLASKADVILQKLVDGVESEEFRDPLEEIVKVRSVQSFSPSQAVSFVYLLKETIRDELRNAVQDRESIDELLEIENRLDQLACMAFDVYARCRERIYELRVNEIKRTGFRLLQKADLVSLDSKLI